MNTDPNLYLKAVSKMAWLQDTWYVLLKQHKPVIGIQIFSI